MKCPEVREFLIAFLDNELDSQMSVDIQLHLEHCCQCANEAEIERMIGKRLTRTLNGACKQPAGDDQTILRHLESDDSAVERRRISRRGRKLWRIGVAAVILIALSVWITMRAGLLTGAPSFADMLIADLTHISADGPVLAVVSDDPEKITTWVREQMRWDVKLPTSYQTAFRLLGVRRCHIGGRYAALTYYQLGETPVSLVILPSSQDDFTMMQTVGAPGLFIDHCKGHVVVARQDGSLTYAAVGRVPQDKLRELIPASL